MFKAWLTLDKLLKLVAREAGDNCIELSVNCTKEGYPRIVIGRKRIVISRLILERKLGRAIRPKLLACHSCDNPKCINERHIFEGNTSSNAVDAILRGGMSRYFGKNRRENANRTTR